MTLVPPGRVPEPEISPPSPNLPKREPKVLSTVEYLRELSRRLDVIAKKHTQGVRATKDVEVAALLIRKLADDWEENG